MTTGDECIAARDALRAEINPPSPSLAEWNDTHARDKRQVVRALRRTARKLRGASR